MTNKYEAPDPYRREIETLRTASAAPVALAGNDARTTAALKTAAAAATLKQFAVDYGADMIAAGIIEHEHVEEFDRRCAEAAERLGVPVSELRLASDDDTSDYSAPNGYDIALKALKEAK